MARLWRAYLPDLEPAAGAAAVLEQGEAHHVVRVLRLRTGDCLALFDGRGVEWEARIERVTSGRIELRLETEITAPVEPGIEVTLFQGRSRPDRMDLVVQKATEIGVGAVLAVGCERAERYDPGPQRIERWRRIAIEACKQSGRRHLPHIDAAEALPGEPGPGVLGILLDAGGGAPPLASIGGEESPGRVWLAVGPEGGFTADEVAGLTDGGWRRASLGPRILRTETAGLVAAALALHLWSDLGR